MDEKKVRDTVRDVVDGVVSGYMAASNGVRPFDYTRRLTPVSMTVAALSYADAKKVAAWRSPELIRRTEELEEKAEQIMAEEYEGEEVQR